MFSVRELGHRSKWFAESIIIFFRFMGHYATSFYSCFSKSQSFGWFTLKKTIFYSGAHLVIPIIFISILISASLSVSLFNILNAIHQSQNALPIAKTITISNVIPMLIGIVLAIQSALNLINANVHKLHHTPDEVMCEYIIPITISLFINGLLLYVYALFISFITIYSTFQYVINIDIHHVFWHLANNVSFYALSYSISKVFMFCFIISLVVGYYYYEISIREVSLRVAVSRIMTRSLFFIILCSAYVTIFFN